MQFSLRHLGLFTFWLCVVLAITSQVPPHAFGGTAALAAALTMLLVALQKRSVYVGIVALATICFALLLLLSGQFDRMSAGTIVPEVTFDAARWARAEPIAGHRTVRSQMIDNLLSRYDFRGWKKSQVYALLGAPDERNPHLRSWDVNYHLGLERAGTFSLDEEFLVFKFNQNGVVIAYRTTVD